MLVFMGMGQACLVPQTVKNLPAVWETWVPSLGWGDPQRREQLPAPVFWPGEFRGLYRPWRRKESDKTEWLSLSLSWEWGSLSLSSPLFTFPALPHPTYTQYLSLLICSLSYRPPHSFSLTILHANLFLFVFPVVKTC